MQRNFEPIRKQVEAWQRSELTDVTAKMVIYEAFVDGKLEASSKRPVEIYLEVSDVDAYHDQLKKRGVNVTFPLTDQ